MEDRPQRWDNDRYRAAIRLSRMGYRLTPIQTNAKLPYFKLLPKGEDGKPHWILLREHPADEATILGWFKRNFKCNIGITLGETGIVVIDCDGPVPEDLPIPDTVTAETIREETGRHFYFKYQGSIERKPMTWVWKEGGIRYKIELKANGRYVVAPPSRFEKVGKVSQYQWSPDKSLFDREPAEFPLEVLDYLDTKISKPVRTKRGQTKKRIKPRLLKNIDELNFEELMRDEDTVLRIMSQLGVDVSAIGPSFCCPLPGHEETNPSASLWRDEDGLIVFHDWHKRDGIEWYAIPHVYACCTTGKSRRTFKPDFVEPWWARALYESGCMDKELPKVTYQTELPLSKDAKAARKFYDGLVYLLQLKLLLHENEDWFKADAYRFTYFSYRLAALWTGMGNKTYGKGKQWLLEAGYIEMATSAEVHNIKHFGDFQKHNKRIMKEDGPMFALRQPYR